MLGADDNDSPEKQVARDSETGRFVKGASGNPNGRPSKRSLRDALRDQVDPDAMARHLVRRSKKSDQVAMFIFNQLEGMPKQKTETEHSGEVLVRQIRGYEGKIG